MSISMSFNTARVKASVRQAVEQGVMEGNLALHAMAVSRAPFRGGDLRSDSIAVGEWVGQYRFLALTAFGMIYATRQHEELSWRHTDGQAKYLESAQADLAGFIRQTIQNHLTGVIR